MIKFRNSNSHAPTMSSRVRSSSLRYHCEVRLWYYLYVDSSGNLQGFVNWYGCWVQGEITGPAASELMQAILDTLPQFDNLMSKALGSYKYFVSLRLALLPAWL